MMENNVNENKDSAMNDNGWAEYVEKSCAGKSKYVKHYFQENCTNEECLDLMFEEIENLHKRYADGEILATEVFGNIIKTVFETRDAMMLIYKKRIEWLENFGTNFNWSEKVFKTEVKNEVKNEETSNEVLSARDEAIKTYINKYAPKFNLVVNSEDFKLNGRGYVHTKEICENFLKEAFCEYIKSKGYNVEVYTRIYGTGYTYTVKLA